VGALPPRAVYRGTGMTTCCSHAERDAREEKCRTCVNPTNATAPRSAEDCSASSEMEMTEMVVPMVVCGREKRHSTSAIPAAVEGSVAVAVAAADVLLPSSPGVIEIATTLRLQAGSERVGQPSLRRGRETSSTLLETPPTRGKWDRMGVVLLRDGWGAHIWAGCSDTGLSGGVRDHPR
jgi:hypothetical protein